MVQQKDYDRTDHGHEHRVDVQARDPADAKLGEDEATDERAHDSEHDVHDHAFASLVDDLAGNPACYQSEDDPTEPRHVLTPLVDLLKMHTRENRCNTVGWRNAARRVNASDSFVSALVAMSRRPASSRR